MIAQESRMRNRAAARAVEAGLEIEALRSRSLRRERGRRNIVPASLGSRFDSGGRRSREI
jgi:hypothetical protein